jgi:hypothetical protein
VKSRETIERYHKRTGRYPERVLADKIYRTRDNLAFCKEHDIRLAGKPLGRPPKDFAQTKKQLRTDETDRIEVERKFSHAKGSFGLGLIRARLEITSKSVIALSILALNIAYIARVSCTFFHLLMSRSTFGSCFEKMGLVQ